ncbi:MAG: hypothetical protein AAF823_02905 [Planctomycetota bacterium]
MNRSTAPGILPPAASNTEPGRCFAEAHQRSVGADDDSWQRVPAYELTPTPKQCQPCEPGAVRFGWRQDALIARFEFVDEYVMSAATSNNQWHYELGDTAEWFLKPVGRPYYWEFYATPNAFVSAMRWPGGSRRGFDPWEDSSAVSIETGPLQDLGDLEAVRIATKARKGWWAELTIDAALLRSKGDLLGPGSHWETLAARYNHSIANDPGPQLSCFPTLARADFHQTHAYAILDWR